MNPSLRLENQDFSFLGKDSTFKGECQLTGPSFISGHFEGNIKMIQGTALTIEREGSFSGKFDGGELHIYGRFHGEIKSNKTVTVHTNADVEGKITALNLVVHPGARANITSESGPSETL